MSAPPTMLNPRPVRPLEMSMVVSHPGIMGQVAGSDTRVAGVEDLLASEKHIQYHTIKTHKVEQHPLLPHK